MRGGSASGPERETLPLTLLERYCSGGATVVERTQVESWILAHPEAIGWVRTPEHDVVRRAREIMGTAVPAPIYGGQAERISKRAPMAHATGRPWARWVGALAAMAMVVAIIGIARESTLLPWAKSDTVLPSATYVTAKGERATITLPDGATVTLNVASRLEVPVDYASGNHTVRLVGEGLFTVPHRDRRPLMVQAGATTARVLGTSFLVRHYTSDTSVFVAVREGKVAVGETVLAAHWAVAVGGDGRPHVQAAQDAAFTFATGVLTLSGLPLSAAIVELDRWYNADIRLGDPSLAKQHVKGEFEAGSLTDLAAILELTFNVRAVRDGRVLTLYPR